MDGKAHNPGRNALLCEAIMLCGPEAFSRYGSIPSEALDNLTESLTKLAVILSVPFPGSVP